MKYVPPSITETAFNCPHCGALAKQFWFSAFAYEMEDGGTPLVVDEARRKEFNFEEVEDKEKRNEFERWADQMLEGRPFFEHRNAHLYGLEDVCNLSLARCQNCNDISVWFYDRLVWPQRGEAPEPNADLPDARCARTTTKPVPSLTCRRAVPSHCCAWAFRSCASTWARRAKTSTTTSRLW